ncbi:response regulator [Scytonema sp. HK-05]|uniref:response regulator n=1 Tax=Scytonema sp. HK-05 TaxID=1137095 RepID=UPI0009365EBD|nr:response regulator [Scytonema sp. HK-05]OKH45279.1 response regulator [Scytonema sp. HK-05]
MRTKKILLIDDEATIRELVQVCLSDLAGWNVVTVASAQAGLKQLAIERPDAIILDVLMPGMDAITFLHRLQQNPLTKAIPVIFLSVRSAWFTSQKLYSLGVVKAIAKPFNPVTLPGAIARALGWTLQDEDEFFV